MAEKKGPGEGTRFRLYDNGPVVSASDEEIARLKAPDTAPKTGANVPTLAALRGDTGDATKGRRTPRRGRADQGGGTDQTGEGAGADGQPPA